MDGKGLANAAKAAPDRLCAAEALPALQPASCDEVRQCASCVHGVEDPEGWMMSILRWSAALRWYAVFSPAGSVLASASARLDPSASALSRNPRWCRSQEGGERNYRRTVQRVRLCADGKAGTPGELGIRPRPPGGDAGCQRMTVDVKIDGDGGGQDSWRARQSSVADAAGSLPEVFRPALPGC